MERILKIRGFEIKLEDLSEEENKKCDIIEEICLVDNRALRLIGWLLQKFGKDILIDGGALDSFIITHDQGDADYSILTKWIESVDQKKLKKDIKHIGYIDADMEEMINELSKFASEFIITAQAEYNSSQVDTLKMLNTLRSLESNDTGCLSTKNKLFSILVLDDIVKIKLIGNEYSMQKDTGKIILRNIINALSDSITAERGRHQISVNNMQFGFAQNIWNAQHNILSYVNPIMSPMMPSTFNAFPSNVYIYKGNEQRYCKDKENLEEAIKENKDIIVLDIVKRQAIDIKTLATRLGEKFNKSSETEMKRFTSFCNFILKDDLKNVAIDMDGDIILLKQASIIFDVLHNYFKIIIDDDDTILLNKDQLRKILEKVLEII